MGTGQEWNGTAAVLVGGWWLAVGYRVPAVHRRSTQYKVHEHRRIMSNARDAHNRYTAVLRMRYSVLYILDTSKIHTPAVSINVIQVSGTKYFGIYYSSTAVVLVIRTRSYKYVHYIRRMIQKLKYSTDVLYSSAVLVVCFSTTTMHYADASFGLKHRYGLTSLIGPRNNTIIQQ